MKSVITISREFGSGGRSIAKALAEKMGYEYFDGEMLERLIQTSRLEPEEMEAEAANQNLFEQALKKIQNKDEKVDNYLWNRQRELILETAERGNCIIVGRCADYILRDYENAMHVFIRADLPYRINRILTHYGEREESPSQRIKQKDAARRANYEHWTQRKWEDVQNYDLVLNSGKLGQERCIELIMKAAQDEF